MKGGWRPRAGRPRRHAKTTDALAVDIRQLHRAGYLRDAYTLTAENQSGARAELYTRATGVTFVYRYQGIGATWQDVTQDVCLLWSPCRYGGQRLWFACPKCSQRAAILYVADLPLCRKCAGLVYPVQRTNAVGRSWLRTSKLEARLGGGKERGPLRRPKGMRGATLDRLVKAYAEESKLRQEALNAYMTRALGAGWREQLGVMSKR